MFKQTMLVLAGIATACGPEPTSPFEIKDQDWQTICGEACAGAPVDVEVGEGSTCIRYEGGAVLCWGIRRGIDDRYAIEGWDNGPLAPSSPRPQITLLGYDENDPWSHPGILDAIDLGVHKNNACVVRRDGTLWCWGRNRTGSLGQGASNFQGSKWPIYVLESERLISVAMSHRACALREDGAVVSPVQVLFVTEDHVSQCAPGQNASCLIRDGHVFCRGGNRYGGLGDGTTEARGDQVQAIGLENMVQVAVGNTHSCAIDDEGLMWCWGGNLYGQLGWEPHGRDENSVAYHVPVPSSVPGLERIIQIEAFSETTCAIQQGGQLFCWGDDNSGVLGTGSDFVNVPTPLPIPNADDIIDVSIAANHGCAIRENGEVACWGSSSNGAIGPEPGRVPYGQLQSVRGLPHHGDWPSSE